MRKFGRLTIDQIPESIEKLPVWAQDYIRHLEREKAGLERQLEMFDGEQSPSDVSWTQMLETEHWIPKHCHVRFYVDEYPGTPVRAHVDVFFRNEGDRRVLEIQGSRSYNIEPRAGNSIYIVMKTREEYYGKREKDSETLPRLQKD